MHFICKCLWRIPWNTVWDNTLQNINYYLSIRTLKLRNSAKHNLHLLVHLTFIIALWGRFYSQLHLRVRKSKYLCYWITPTRRCNYRERSSYLLMWMMRTEVIPQYKLVGLFLNFGGVCCMNIGEWGLTSGHLAASPFTPPTPTCWTE